MRQLLSKMIPILLIFLLLSGCSQPAVPSGSQQGDGSQVSYVDVTEVEEAVIEDEAVALADAPAALPTELNAVASGVLVKKNNKAIIDYSNTKDGYVMVKFTAATDKRLKALVKGPNTADAYNYNLTAGEWATFPLSDGNGKYQVTVHENVSGTKYASVLSLSCDVTLTDEFAPFLRPNQYVDYASAPNSVAKAKELTAKSSTTLQKVEAVYSFVVKNLTYDKEKAANVQSGYLPVLDTVLSQKTGICFDYAALMAGMLRSQGVPCKLVVGYAGTVYHAWINVWSEETGWVEGAIYFDGTSWQRMDPTFASSGKQSASIMAYIGDGKNYKAKYLY